MPIQSKDFLTPGMSESRAYAERTKADLLVDVLSRGARVQLRVFGTSMLPTLWPGDLVAIEPLTSGLADGEIVLARREGHLFIHRLVVCGSNSDAGEWVTRGDSLAACDPAVPLRDIIGRICGVSRRGRVQSLSPKMSLLGRSLAWLFYNSDFLTSVALCCHAFAQALHLPESGARQESASPVLAGSNFG